MSLIVKMCRPLSSLIIKRHDMRLRIKSAWSSQFKEPLIISGGVINQFYSTKHSYKKYSEEETLSYKVLEHMRTHPVYAGTLKNEEILQSSNVFGDKYVIKQLLLVIAHSSEVKVDDVLKLFSVYVSSEHHMTLDVISDKSLMKAVLSKIDQSLSMMKASEIQLLALSLRKLEFKKIGYLSKLAKTIAIHCENMALESDYSNALELFKTILILYGNNIYKTKHYDTFMSIFESNTKNAQPHDLVQILHYIGLGKNKKISMEFVYNVIKHLDPHVNALSFTDIGIAAAGIFKSGVLLDCSSIFTQAIVQQLKSVLQKLHINDELESYGLIAMIKLLRFVRVQDEDLLNLMTDFIQKGDTSLLSPQTVPHILAFYANSRVYHQDVFRRLEKTILKDLRTANSLIRMRDLTRLLWCFSHTGHELNEELKKEIIGHLIKFLHYREVTKSPYLLSDALLSLAVLGHYPKQLIEDMFEQSKVIALKGHQRSKQLSRLLILSKCLKVEAPELSVKEPSVSPEELPVRTLTDEICHRPLLATLWEGAKLLNDSIGMQVFRLKFVVPHINYASLTADFSHLSSTGSFTDAENISQQERILQQLCSVKEKYEGQFVALELLDSQMLLQNSLDPIGIIRLKLRLMQKTGWNVKEVYNNEVDDADGDIRAIAALIIEKITNLND
ncbi:hypothetical protein SK128_013906 [Halocaridina rubra]|uniref:FAST kinase leucine-rich domain-containing protein n=1 Tax=Halocaridina rubra TaxID=373956 RepID=A0AAN8WL17_HALRR